MSSNRRPKILFGVTSDLSLRLLRGFPDFLENNGWEVHVVCSPGPILDAIPHDVAVHYHPLMMPRNPAPIADVQALIEWIRLLREIRPDLISVGTPKAGLLGGLAGWITRVPRRVYHQRGLRLETSKGAERLFLRLSERTAVGVAHRVLAVSPSLRAQMLSLGLSSPEKIVVVGAGSSNGVDVQEFAPGRFSPKTIAALRDSVRLRVGLPVVGYVGRLTRDKGFDDLEKAVRALRDRGTEFSLLIVGQVDDQVSQATLNRLETSGIAVAATGSVADPAIYYQLMDVLCLPTHREGYPNVVLEASASERPTVTTDATGAVDSVVGGRTGIVVPTGDSEALADGLEQLLNSPELRVKMGESARQHVQRYFARPEVWNLLQAFYTSELASARERQPTNWKHSFAKGASK